MASVYDPESVTCSRIYHTVARTISNVLFSLKRFRVKGIENCIETGPNIIVGNHPTESIEDVCALIKVYGRKIFFVVNENLLTEEGFDYEIRHSLGKNIGKNKVEALLRVFSGLCHKVFEYSCTLPGRIGSIPVNIYGRGLNGTSFKRIKNYLLRGFPVVFLQTNGGQHRPNEQEPDVKEVTRVMEGAALVAAYMYERHGINVPITPVGLKGTSVWSRIKPVQVNIGRPVYYGGFDDKSDKRSTRIRKLTDFLERTLIGLYNGSKKT
jgi:hypothetical protein